MKLKKITYLPFILALVLCINSTSCSKDDDNEAIVGTWVLNDVDLEGIKTNNAAFTEAFGLSIIEELGGQSIIFHDNGKYEYFWNEGEESGSGTYVYKNGKLTMDGESVSCTISGNTLIVEVDYASEYNNLEGKEYIIDEYGLSIDANNVVITGTIAKAKFVRQ